MDFDFTYHDTKMSDRINMRCRPKTGTKLSPLKMIIKIFKYHLITVKNCNNENLLLICSRIPIVSHHFSCCHDTWSQDLKSLLLLLLHCTVQSAGFLNFEDIRPDNYFIKVEISAIAEGEGVLKCDSCECGSSCAH